MSKEQIAKLEQCPDCCGAGTLTTPATHWAKIVKCARCWGNGYITKPYALNKE